MIRSDGLDKDRLLRRYVLVLAAHATVEIGVVARGREVQRPAGPDRFSMLHVADVDLKCASWGAREVLGLKGLEVLAIDRQEGRPNGVLRLRPRSPSADFPRSDNYGVSAPRTQLDFAPRIAYLRPVRLPSNHLEHLMAHHAGATPGVIDRCVAAVAAGGPLEGVLPQFSAREVALVARDALEVLEMLPALGERAIERDVRAGDWALGVIAAFRLQLAREMRKHRKPALADATMELAEHAIEAIAASDDRSCLLWYHDLLFDASQSLARRGDRTAITRQIECIAEELHEDQPGNLRGALRDLGIVHLDLNEHRIGLTLLAELQRDDPSDPWTYNVLASSLPRCGLPSLAGLAAERGIALVRSHGDPEDLGRRFSQMLRETRSAVDRADAPADAIAALRDALHAPFDATTPSDPVQLAHRLVPTLATARVKVLPPMLDQAALARIASGLRGFLAQPATARPGFGSLPLSQEPPRTLIDAGLVPTDRPISPAPKIGRNSPCPCGSGKKYKKCCLQ